MPLHCVLFSLLLVLFAGAVVLLYVRPRASVKGWTLAEILANPGTEFAVLHADDGHLVLTCRQADLCQDWPQGLEPPADWCGMIKGPNDVYKCRHTDDQ